MVAAKTLPLTVENGYHMHEVYPAQDISRMGTPSEKPEEELDIRIIAGEERGY